LFAAGAGLQEYTVFGRLMFDNRRSKPHPPEVFLPELPHRHFQKIGNDFNLRPRHPDIPLSRPRAAPPTPPTLKMQTRNVPQSFFSNYRFHRILLIEIKN